MTDAADEAAQWERRIHIRIGRGEAAALGELYDRHADLVHAVAARLLGEEKAAQRTVTSVFTRLWQHPEGYDPARYRLRTWLTMAVCEDVARRTVAGTGRPTAPAEVDETLGAMSSPTRAALRLVHTGHTSESPPAGDAGAKDYRRAATELGTTPEELLGRLRRILRSVADAADTAREDRR
ncbi:sigma factor [Streptomyces sp. NPDC003717]|uniref:sigma factor n=1 Tax=Streptomyces sp. NPDC003717 TaxID=3154276 RepID=UPI0033BBC475